VQVKTKLKYIRKIKASLYRFRIHRLLGALEMPLMMAGFLVKASRWIERHRKCGFNDFYTANRNYDRRFDAFSHVIEKEQLDGRIDYLEFGVFGGKSFQWWAKANSHPDSRFVGFDTFSGLPEDWDLFKKGEMSVQGNIPELEDPRCRFVAGLFQNTLPGFLAGFERGDRLVVHMDADLYTSTLYVLGSLASILRAGDIIFFDEFNIPLHEFRAFTDFTESFYIKYRLLSAVNNYTQIGVKIL